MDAANVEGSTPLNPDDEAALIPSHIESQEQLNEWEQGNIAAAVSWLERKRPEQVLTMSFLRKLHKRMFDKTWRWAGTFRTSGTNLGVEPYEIQPELHKLLKDTEYWIEHKTYSDDEIAARFHHRLVSIHPFPNGNGRHGRLMTEALQVQMGTERFTWGRTSLTKVGAARTAYLAALQEADRGRYDDLIALARS